MTIGYNRYEIADDGSVVWPMTNEPIQSRERRDV